MKLEVALKGRLMKSEQHQSNLGLWHHILGSLHAWEHQAALGKNVDIFPFFA